MPFEDFRYRYHTMPVRPRAPRLLPRAGASLFSQFRYHAMPARARTPWGASAPRRRPLGLLAGVEVSRGYPQPVAASEGLGDLGLHWGHFFHQISPTHVFHKIIPTNVLHKAEKVFHKYDPVEVLYRAQQRNKHKLGQVAKVVGAVAAVYFGGPYVLTLLKAYGPVIARKILASKVGGAVADQYIQNAMASGGASGQMPDPNASYYDPSQGTAQAQAQAQDSSYSMPGAMPAGGSYGDSSASQDASAYAQPSPSPSTAASVGKVVAKAAPWVLGALGVVELFKKK